MSGPARIATTRMIRLLVRTPLRYSGISSVCARYLWIHLTETIVHGLEGANSYAIYTGASGGGARTPIRAASPLAPIRVRHRDRIASIALVLYRSWLGYGGRATRSPSIGPGNLATMSRDSQPGG